MQRSRRWDHPRIRGEHVIGWFGKLLSKGIIPAYAGSTSGEPAATYRTQDHPRIRGEHPLPLRALPRHLGSSPHTRGAPSACWSAISGHRIIPAYAGSTQACLQERQDRRDHPRIRGEHYFYALVDGVDQGIIPAYAGSTPLGCRASSSHQDHPRIRGEHSMSFREVGTLVGSSPHTRGAPQ